MVPVAGSATGGADERQWSGDDPISFEESGDPADAILDAVASVATGTDQPDDGDADGSESDDGADPDAGIDSTEDSGATGDSGPTDGGRTDATPNDEDTTSDDEPTSVDPETVASLEDRIDALSDRVDDLESEQATIAEDVAETDASEASLEAEVDAIRTNVDHVVDLVEAALSTIESQVAAVPAPDPEGRGVIDDRESGRDGAPRGGDSAPDDGTARDDGDASPNGGPGEDGTQRDVTAGRPERGAAAETSRRTPPGQRRLVDPTSEAVGARLRRFREAFDQNLASAAEGGAMTFDEEAGPSDRSRPERSRTEGVATGTDQADAAGADDQPPGSHDQPAGPHDQPAGTDAPTSGTDEGPSGDDALELRPDADEEFEYDKVLLPSSEAVAPELVGSDVEKPYLEALPDGYAAETAIIEWLDWLVSTTDEETALRAVGYYETIDWITPAVRETLASYLDGVGAGEVPTDVEAPPDALELQDHLHSLRYVTELATGEVSADGI